MLHRSIKIFEVSMFSALAIAFAARRNVVLAERHVPALGDAFAQQSAPAAPIEAPAAAPKSTELRRAA
jgi:hypothetical protein